MKEKKRKAPPALTPEGRLQQMIALAYDRAEEQLLEGTASSQVITHFLKQGAERAKHELELEKIKNENLLLQTRVKAIEAEANQIAVVEAAIKAMKMYSGNGGAEEDEEYEIDD